MVTIRITKKEKNVLKHEVNLALVNLKMYPTDSFNAIIIIIIGVLGNKRWGGDSPDYTIIKIGQNSE